MRISDWSSDVCSSDLGVRPPALQRRRTRNYSARALSYPGRTIPCLFYLVDDVKPVDVLRGGHPDDGCAPFEAINRHSPRSRQRPSLSARATPALRRGWRASAPFRRECGLPLPPARRWKRPVCRRLEEHTSELPSLMRISSAVFCLKK